MMTTREALLGVFCNNFTTYFRSHVAHVNIMGRNFASDHALLGGIYEELQGQIDILAELLRTLGEFMPNDIQTVVNESIMSSSAMDGSSEDLLMAVREDVGGLKALYEDLMLCAEDEGLQEIANYAQERILALAKHIWMLEATLS